MFNCTKSRKIYACFIDLRKAFDTVWHEGLLLKLQKAEINGNIYDLIKSVYQEQGVHQGSVLSPLLFNIFMNDIGDSLLLDDAPMLPDYKLNHLLSPFSQYFEQACCTQGSKMNFFKCS